MNEPSVRFACLPVDGPITQKFGDTAMGYPHRGCDFGVPEGTPVKAPADGTVTQFTNSQTQWQGQTVRSFGIGVCLAVGDGWWILLAHLSQSLVNIGDIVRAGQVIGYSGNTGVSTGPHLHYQLSDSPAFPTDISQSRDPLAYMEDDPMEPFRLSLLQIAGGDYDRLNSDYQILVDQGFPLPRQFDDDLNGAVVRRFAMIELAASSRAKDAYIALGGKV